MKYRLLILLMLVWNFGFAQTSIFVSTTGDVIIALNGNKVHDTKDLFETYKKSLGKKAEVVVTRNSIKRSFSFVVK